MERPFRLDEGMARTKTYDRAAVIVEAMFVFWKLGYEQTSMQALTEGTGLSRSSIYEAFGSKRGLFDAVLDRYFEGIDGLVQPLENGGLDSITAFFENWRARRFDPDPTFGCLVVNSIAELAPHDPEFFSTATHYQSTLEDNFRRSLEIAEEAGETEPGSAAARAKILVALVMGIFVASRGQTDNRAVDGLLDAAISQVSSWRS